LALLVRDGDPAPGTAPGTVFGGGVFGTGGYTFPLVVSNSSSQLAIKANLLGPVNAFNDEGVWVETTGTLTLLAREGDPAPGIPGNVVFGSASGVSGFEQLSINSTGHVAFISRLTPPFHLGLWSNRDGALALIAESGQPAPGSGIVFTSFFGPLLDEAGNIAFMGSGDSITGIWTDRDGPMMTVVQQGQQVENQPVGVTFTNSGINTFQLLAFNESGVMAFSAGINDPEQGPQSGLLLNDPKLGTHLIVATGDLFDVFGDGSDVRTIERIVYGGLSADGQVAFRLDFTDQSSAHYAASITTVQPCLSDISGDGVVNSSDLLAVINSWGPCAPGDGVCAADISGDGVVNSSDLLMVINTWGPCQ
jgi:hypothetical protein